MPQINHVLSKLMAHHAIPTKLKAAPDLTMAELRGLAACGTSGLDQSAPDLEGAAPA